MPIPSFIGPFECLENDTFAKLRPLLQGNHIVDWPFQFSDVENKRGIKCKLKELNRVFSVIYVMPLVEPDLESKKHMRVIDLDFIFNSQQTLKCLAEEVKIQDLTPFDDFDQSLPPLVGSRVSGERFIKASILNNNFISFKFISKGLQFVLIFTADMFTMMIKNTRYVDIKIATIQILVI